MRAIKASTFAAILALGLAGCSASKNVVYIQDATPEKIIEMASKQNIKIEPGDEIMVFVSCTDPEMAGRLSLMSGSRQPQHSAGGVSSYNSQVMLPYTVSQRGDITMPEIGTIHVAGLTRQEISRDVVRKITESNLVKDGSVNVTVQFANLTYTTLGEFKNTGTYNIAKDNLTVLEAIAASGDLTIHGRRDKVWVIREEPDGKRKLYQLDLRGTEFMASPAYYIQQNDVIYVEPNDVRAGQSTLNENTFKSIGFWTSLASLAITIATFAITLAR